MLFRPGKRLLFQINHAISTSRVKLTDQCRGVAQSGSAPASGAGGRRFESSRPDHIFLFIFQKICPTLRLEGGAFSLVPPVHLRSACEIPCFNWLLGVASGRTGGQTVEHSFLVEFQPISRGLGGCPGREGTGADPGEKSRAVAAPSTSIS